MVYQVHGYHSGRVWSTITLSLSGSPGIICEVSINAFLLKNSAFVGDKQPYIAITLASVLGSQS